MANRKYPSAMGCSFSVDTRMASSLLVSVRAARYVPTAPDPSAEITLKRARRNQTIERLWNRLPCEYGPVSVDLARPIHGRRISLEEGLKLFVRLRPAVDGIAAITVMLLNEKPLPEFGSLRDDRCYFQTQITVAAPDREAVFIERPRAAPGADDEDLRNYRLL